MAKTNTSRSSSCRAPTPDIFYVTKKNARAQTGKLEFKKYDPVARKHVVFKEAKIKYSRPAMSGQERSPSRPRYELTRRERAFAHCAWRDPAA